MKKNEPQMKFLTISQVEESPKNPRKTFNEESIHELAASILEKGLLQPIIVRPKGKKYEVVAGARRLKACKIAELKQIPAIIREDLTDEEAFDLMITENLQREDVSPVEEARAFVELIKMKNDYTSLAIRFGKSEVYIRQRVKLNELIDEFMHMLDNEYISISVAMEIAKLPSDLQRELYENNDYSSSHNFNPKLKTVIAQISRLTPVLSDASFDLTSKDLIKKAGSCITCPNNTGSDMLLFPEKSEQPKCLNPKCFTNKKNIHISNEIKRVMTEENETIIGYRSWDSYRFDDEIKKLIEENIPVVEVRGDIIEMPEPPDKNDFNMEDPEEKEDYNDQLEQYNEELEEYKENLKSDKLKYALFVVGDNAGKIIPFIPNSNYGMSNPSAGQPGEVSIDELKDKIRRNNELILENTNKSALKFLKDNLHKDSRSLVDGEIFELTGVTILYALMLDSIPLYMPGEALKKIFIKYLKTAENSKIHKRLFEVAGKLTTEEKNTVFREFILHRIDVSHQTAAYDSNRGKYDVMLTLLKTLWSKEAENLINPIQEKYDKKNTKLQERIKALKQSNETASISHLITH